MKVQRLVFLSILLLLGYSGLYAQNNYIFLQDAKGNVVGEHAYINVEGSAFLNPAWLSGTITLVNNKTYKDISLKYDEVKDQVYVRGPNDDMILLNDKVISFDVCNLPSSAVGCKSFKSGYQNVPGLSDNAYFEVLTTGKAQLLKHYIKRIQENKDYNSATATKEFVEDIKYYLVAGGKAIQVKRDKSAILDILSDKRNELETYIKSNNISFKKEDDIAKLITYYNSI